MMKNIKVLHFASFIGNIGDNANHFGSRKWFSKIEGLSFDFENLEIREFYWKNLQFDEQFAAKCNEYDLILIGGGNFFELWVENSATGTSINISEKILSLIEKPILFYSLGVDDGQGHSDQTLSRFRNFLDFVSKYPEKYFLSVRNDGSILTVDRLLGSDYAKMFVVIPDGGFFLTLDEQDQESSLLTNVGAKLIGINLAGDMLDKRFNPLHYNRILLEFYNSIAEISQIFPQFKFIFFPHILKDIALLNDLLKVFDDQFFRKKIIIAPLINGDYGMKQIFRIYSQCDLVIANRFHSNVCSIAMCKPTIGLVNYSQISLLYKELKLNDRTINIHNPGFKSNLVSLANSSLNNYDELIEKYRAIKFQIELQMNDSFNKVSNWISNNVK